MWAVGKKKKRVEAPSKIWGREKRKRMSPKRRKRAERGVRKASRVLNKEQLKPKPERAINNDWVKKGGGGGNFYSKICWGLVRFLNGKGKRKSKR